MTDTESQTETCKLDRQTEDRNRNPTYQLSKQGANNTESPQGCK